MLKLMAPFLPHITEEIYHLYFSKKEKKQSIHVSDWPIFNKNLVDEKAEKTGDMAVEIITQVRKFKSEKSLSLKEDVSLLAISCSEEDRKLLEIIIDDLKSVTRAKDIEFLDNKELKVKIKL